MRWKKKKEMRKKNSERRGERVNQRSKPRETREHAPETQDVVPLGKKKKPIKHEGHGRGTTSKDKGGGREVPELRNKGKKRR